MHSLLTHEHREICFPFPKICWGFCPQAYYKEKTTCRGQNTLKKTNYFLAVTWFVRGFCATFCAWDKGKAWSTRLPWNFVWDGQNPGSKLMLYYSAPCSVHQWHVGSSREVEGAYNKMLTNPWKNIKNIVFAVTTYLL